MALSQLFVPGKHLAAGLLQYTSTKVIKITAAFCGNFNINVWQLSVSILFTERKPAKTEADIKLESMARKAINKLSVY